MLQFLYYGAFALVSLIGLFLFLAKGADMMDKSSFHQFIFYLLSLASGGGLMYLAFQWGHQQGNWLGGIGVIVLAVIAVGIITLIGLATYKGGIHWQ